MLLIILVQLAQLASRKRKFELLESAKISSDQNAYDIYKKYLNVFTRLKKHARILYYKERAATIGQNKSKT